MVDRMISPFTLMAGPILFVLSMILIRNIESWDEVVTALCIYIVWVLVSRTLRIIPHFYRCPGVQFPRRCFTCSQCEFVGVQGAAALSLLSRTRGLKSLSGCLFHQPDTVGTNSLFCFWADILFCALIFAHPVEAAVLSAIAHLLRFSVERSGCSCCSVPSRAALCPHVMHAQCLLRTHCLSAAYRQAKTVTWPPSLLMSRTCRAVAVAIPSRCRCREAELAHHTRPSSSHASSLLCRVVPAPHLTVERPPQQPSMCWLDSRCTIRCNSIAMQSSHALSHSTAHNRCRACTHSTALPSRCHNVPCCLQRTSRTSSFSSATSTTSPCSSSTRSSRCTSRRGARARVSPRPASAARAPRRSTRRWRTSSASRWRRRAARRTRRTRRATSPSCAASTCTTSRTTGYAASPEPAAAMVLAQDHALRRTHWHPPQAMHARLADSLLPVYLTGAFCRRAYSLQPASRVSYCAIALSVYACVYVSWHHVPHPYSPPHSLPSAVCWSLGCVHEHCPACYAQVACAVLPDSVFSP